MMAISREYADLESDARQFLNREALLLDSGDLEGWLAILAPDVSYRVPVRTTRYGRTEDEFSAIAAHFDEDLFTLTMRVKRLGTRYAWAEDPPSRSRHLVSNIIVTSVSDGPEFEVASSLLLLLRTRFDDGRTESLSGARADTLRRGGGGLELARRVVYLDQTTLPVGSITTFL
jgi:3-phenylpropionate/cinnamic acid dioxygenase small subunit